MRPPLPLLLVVALAACSGDSSPGASAPNGPPAEVEQRFDAIAQAVDDWAASATLEEAHRAAETARNLVVGPGGPLYGDADGPLGIWWSGPAARSTATPTATA